MKPDIYLDVDGVLVVSGRQPARHANEFLRKVLTDYPDTTYWLTTLCNGDAALPVSYIGRLFEPDVVELMQRIKPTAWQTAKTSAIDFSKPFLWFDDNLFAEDRAALLKHGVLANWIEVDLAKNPDTLARFLINFPAPKFRKLVREVDEQDRA